MGERPKAFVVLKEGADVGEAEYSWTVESAGVFGSTFEPSTAQVWDSAGVYASGRSITVTLEVSDGTYVDSVSRTVPVR